MSTAYRRLRYEKARAFEVFRYHLEAIVEVVGIEKTQRKSRVSPLLWIEGYRTHGSSKCLEVNCDGLE